MKHYKKALSTRLNKNPAPQTKEPEQVESDEQDSEQQDMVSSLSAENQPLNIKLLINKMVQYQDEATKVKQELEDLKSVKAKIEQEKNSYIINSELVKTARKVNVRDTALDDVVSLLAGKLTLDNGKVIPVEKPATALEDYIKEWVGTKEHYLAPTAAPSTGASPVPASQLPVQQPVELDPGSVESLTNFARHLGGFLKK